MRVPRTPRLAPLLLVLVSLTPGEATAQTTARAGGFAGAEAISAERVQAAIEHLASDALEGRGSGAEGGRRAGAWLAAQCRALGLTPGGTEGYFQPFSGQGQQMRNVVAVLPGLEAGETVVIGAHYDHLGLGHQSGSLAFGRGEGQVHNGADDNASGTAGVLEVARAFLAAGEQPRRTVVFVWFDGEERGLLGSRAFVAQPPVTGRVTLMINLDMVGRLGRRLTVFGAPTGDRLGEWVAAANAGLGLGLDLDLRQAITANSDHAPFYRAGVPVLVPFTGLHGDYHRPSDDVGAIDCEGVAQVARLTYGVALQATRAEQVLAFHEVPDGTLQAALEQLQAMVGGDGDLGDRLRGLFGGGDGEGLDLGRLFGDGEGRRGLRDVLRQFLGGGDRRPPKPRLGVTLDSLTVRSVTPGSVAAGAGLAVGDRIVGWGDRPVTSLDDLRRAVARAEGRVAIEVERGGQRRTLWAQFGGAKPQEKPQQPAEEPAPPQQPRWF